MSSSFDDSYTAAQSTDNAALSYVRDYFGDCSVFSAESGRPGEIIGPQDAEEALEFSHVDGIIYDSGVSFGFGLRVRPWSRRRRDFSLRVTLRSGEEDTELQHLRHAMESGGILPKYYVFGFSLDSSMREMTGVTLRHLFIFDTRVVLDALDSESVDVEGPKPSDRDNPDDDSEAIYVDIDDLREAGAIVHEVHNAEWPTTATGAGNPDDN